MPRKKRNPCRNPEQDTPTPDQNGPETSGTVANRRIDDPPSPGQSPRRRRPRTLAPQTSGAVAKRRIDDPTSPGQSPRRRRPRTLTPRPITQDLPFTWRRVPPLPYNQTASSSSSGDWLPLGADAGNFNTELSPRFRRPMEAETTYDVSVITSSRASDDEVVCLEERVEQPETQGANPRNSHFSVGDDEFENQMSFSEYFGTATTNNVSRDDDGVICLEDMVEQPETQGTNPQTSHFSVEDDEFENQMSFSDYFGTATTNNVNRDDDGVICWEDMVVQRETQGTNPRRSLFLVGDDEFENQMNFSDFFGTATTINKDENNVVDLDKMERSEEPTTPRKETTNHRPRLYSLPPELESTTDMHIRWDDLMNNTSPLSAARLGLLPPPLPSDMKNKNSMKTFNVHGNNTLQQEPVYETMDQFVASFVSDKSKRRPIYKILVATNGIASVRCILAIRKLLMKTFRNDRMIQFICLTTEHEVQSNAEYLKLADYIVFSPSGSNKNNYANVDEIVRHAIEQNVDAVWAGWGHASENPELPKKLAEHNISFIGPPSEAMSSLGDKIASTLIAQTVGIPTIEWSGSGIKMESEKRAPGRIVEVPQELIDLATVANVKEGLKALKKHKIGFPLMIKASAGGGGKGIRKCTRKEDFKDMFEQVCQEVENSPIFLMKCVENARHIEVQLIADRYETVIPVFTRDCSIQRRCQKIIEEAPASIADEEILKQMQEDAVRLAKFVGYESAGTVEYMYLPDEKKYYFLELNPRLQVEHPCTEMISNMSIPAIQLQIAMGLPLHRIEDIRLFFGLDRYGDSPLPAETVLTKTAYCVIAARITSENPDDSFRPSIGAVEVLNFRSSQDVWGYFSVSSGGKVHEYADSQFGHLFARGRTRMEAVSSLLAALKELELRATFHSQVQYLVDLLLEPDFTHNRFNTQWLDIRIAQKIKQKPTFPMNEVVAVSAAVIGHTRVTTVFENFRAAIDRGQVLPPNDLTETFLFDLVQDLQIYSMTVVRCAPLSYVVTMNGLSTRVNMIVLGNGNLMVTHGESVHQCSLVETSELFKVTIGKTINVFEKDNDPSVLKSPYTGKLLSYKRETGDEVRVGDVYATVESMKLVFNTEVTKAPGRFLQVANEGDLLFPGSIIARLTDQMDVELYKPKKYQKAFEEWNTDNEEMDVADHKAFKKLIQKCDDVMNGSAPLGGELVVAQYVKDLFNNFLAKSELPKIVYLPAITSLISKLEEKHQKWLFVEIHSPDFNLTKIITYIRENCQKADDEVRELADRMEYECKHGYACHVIESIFQKYIAVEKYFEDKIYDESVTEIKKDVSDSGKVVEVIYSHMMREYKNVVLFTLMEMLATKAVFWIPHLTESLRALGNLHNAKGISRKARELLMLTLTHKYHQNFEELKLEVSPFSPNVSDILKWLECPAPSSQLWNNIHEYFFDPVYGEKIVDAYVNNFLQAIERENYQVLENNFTAQVKIADISPPTDLHQVQLPKKTLTVVRLLFPNLASLNVREIERLFKEHLADEEYRRSTYTVLYMKIEGVEEPLDTKFEVIPSLTRNELQIVEQFKKVSAELVDKYGPEFRCSLCLPRRPLIGCDFVDALRLKLDELPEGAKLVSSPISSVHTYQLNDNDNQFASLRTYQVLSFRKRGTARMMKDLSSETIFNAIDAAATAAKVVMASSDKKFTENYGQVFLVLPNCDEKEGEEVGRIIKEELEKYMDVLVKHNFSKFEIIFTTKISSTLSDPTRKYVQFENYGGALTLVNVVSKSYWKMEPLTVRNKKQYSTRLNDTIYVYDVPMLIANCIDNRWDRVAKKDIGFYRTIKALLPDSVQVAMKHKDWESIIKFHEIALEDQQLKFYDSVDFSHRKNIAPNRCGIVGYVVEVQLPEYFGRRKFVVIANDITYQSGSFGTDEDDLFAALSNYAQDENLPIVNISCNSGARIGLASTVMKYLKVQLREGSETFDYIYIDEEDMKHVEDQVVVTRLPNGHCAIDAVIGAKNERIGVENLMGSGLIAGCTAEAYSKVPTYCFVTGRSVGIGAYTARLAHRIVQHKSSNLILTGSAALNTLLGKKVYSSNNQLGGIDIMHRNGVAHAVAENNSAGIDKILDWLSYLPQQEDRTGPLTSIVPPPVPNTGDVDPRSVSKPPSSGMKDFDVRQLIDSTELGIDTGICDSGSFDEISSEWAKSIITGRARLCDIPIGVIATELRNFNTLTPADPAVEGSEAQNTIRAGQVWYPDSAYKTAEAINDFAVEKIPLLFIASLRGFSSGQKDMYDMVLKFGAEIVSALRAYKRPVIVYIPAFGELRGGAWAVLDKNINPEFITMVADDTSRGGILEPNAIVSIKFREDKQRKLMQNSDAAFKQLSDRLKKETDSVKRLELSEMLKEREETLRKSYRAAAVEFADAHDRHDRMQSVGAVQHTVELHQTRHLFHNIIKCELIRVRMAEELLVVPSLKPLSLSEAMKIVRTEVEQYAETAYFNIEDLYGTLIQFFDAKWQTVRQNYLQKCSEEVERQFALLRNSFCTFQQSSSPIRDEEKPRINLPNTML